jgi:hypothetical protein
MRRAVKVTPIKVMHRCGEAVHLEVVFQSGDYFIPQYSECELSWDVPNEHRCEAMKTTRYRYLVERVGEDSWNIRSDDCTALVHGINCCPWCGEKLR